MALPARLVHEGKIEDQNFDKNINDKKKNDPKKGKRTSEKKRVCSQMII